jgi:isopentenyl diphosphate isomerase/L-lactate dehydrogenase-like FMN-dependent dehydrogenase
MLRPLSACRGCRRTVSLRDVELRARARLDPAIYDFCAGGAGSEQTLAENRRAFRRIFLRPRVMVDTSHVDTTVAVLGQQLTSPVLIAPTAFNRVVHADAEPAVARAAAAAGTVMVVSTMASTAVEEIAAAADGRLWFQLYVFRDRGLTRELVDHAAAAGCCALVLTVDAPRIGRRERDLRNQFVLPAGVHAPHLESAGRPSRWGAGSTFAGFNDALLEPSLTWDVVEWLRSVTTLPLIVKGILAADDAECAIGVGANGIIVSNHGGRQLDGALATIDALPAVVDRVAARGPVLMDGGVRRGTDVLKALARGASAVLIGRPVLWGLADAGEEGVRAVLELLRNELELAMALAGCPSISAITRALVAFDDAPGATRRGGVSRHEPASI